MVFTFGIIHLLLLSSSVLVHPCLCPTTSLSTHVFVLPRLCPPMSLSYHVFVHPCLCHTTSLSYHVFVQPCLCPIMSLSNHVLVLPCPSNHVAVGLVVGLLRRSIPHHCYPLALPAPHRRTVHCINASVDETVHSGPSDGWCCADLYLPVTACLTRFVRLQVLRCPEHHQRRDNVSWSPSAPRLVCPTSPRDDK